MTAVPTRIDARAVLYREGPDWLAHCIDFDLLGDGTCQGAAVRSLMEAIRLQLEATRESGDWNNLFFTADAESHLLFARGEPAGEEEGPRSGEYHIGRVELRLRRG